MVRMVSEIERKRGADLRAQLFALHHRGRERLDVVNRGAVGETPECLTKRAARRQLGRDHRQLGADFLLLPQRFGADYFDRFTQAETGFDADHQ